jgi:transposase
MQPTIIGLDLAKSVFQIHGVDGQGQVAIRRKLRRREVMPFFEKLAPCLVGMEACATAHFWTRELSKLGHEVRMMPPNYVKPYLRRQKNDAADAEAICEAVQRPNMRFVTLKSAERQSVLTLHKARELLVRQRTMLINAIRSHGAEFGLIAPLGALKVDDLIEDIRVADKAALPDIAKTALLALASQLRLLADEIGRLDRRLMAWHRRDEVSQRLATIPGVGVISATALSASIPDPTLFRSGREFAAFLGLVPRQNSSGGKDRLGRISKMGDGYLRKLLVVGATSVVRRAKTDELAAAPWVRSLLERRPARIATVAMANKTARIAWAIMARGEVYRPVAA